MMGLPEGRKSFKMGLAILIQYRRVTDRHPASQPRRRSIYRAYYVARVTSRPTECLCKPVTQNNYTVNMTRVHKVRGLLHH